MTKSKYDVEGIWKYAHQEKWYATSENEGAVIAKDGNLVCMLMNLGQMTKNQMKANRALIEYAPKMKWCLYETGEELFRLQKIAAKNNNFKMRDELDDLYNKLMDLQSHIVNVAVNDAEFMPADYQIDSDNDVPWASKERKGE